MIIRAHKRDEKNLALASWNHDSSRLFLGMVKAQTPLAVALPYFAATFTNLHRLSFVCETLRRRTRGFGGTPFGRGSHFIAAESALCNGFPELFDHRCAEVTGLS